MSPRRGQGGHVGGPDAVGVIGSRSFGTRVVLGLPLVAIFLRWLIAAESIYELTLGFPTPGIRWHIRARRVHRCGRPDNDRGGYRCRLSFLPAGTGDQRRIVSAVARLR